MAGEDGMHQAGHQRDGPGPGRQAIGRQAIRAGWLLAVALLCGCRQQKTAGAEANGDGARVVVAAEQDLLAAMPAAKAARFRGVHAYTQAMPGRWAICGQVSPFADDTNIYVPFVSVGAPDGKAGYRFDREVGTTTAAADRVYIALVTYCYDKGGPVPGPFQSVTPMPPLPDMIADPSRRDSPASAVPLRSGVPLGPRDSATVEQSPASGTVIMRQNANLHATPHGPPLRVVQQGTAMRILATAPGGWYQVGDAASQGPPWGWVHESMVERR